MQTISSHFSDKLSYYQSANNDNQSIKNNFVVRIQEFELIISTLKSKKSKDPLQHELILGRRGSGKSTLLKRIQIELEENKVLNKKYIAINLAEEQSGIYRLFDLWAVVLEDLQEQFKLSKEDKNYDEFNSNEEYARYLYQEIHKITKKEKRKIVLLLDNFDRIVENFEDDGHLLRETLINYNNIQIIGGSTRMSEHFWQYDLPFYEFFRRHRLDALSTKEMIKLINHWSETLNIKQLKSFVKNNKGKIEAVRILTDGLPRTLQFFIEILLDNSFLYGYEYLKRIMDKVTPIYQERLSNLTPQLRKIVAEMAFIWSACTTKQLVIQCKMPSKLVSANLKTLIDKGIVDKIPTGKKNHLYRISERFFNMWFIVTQGSPVHKRKAKWLSIFLEAWYDKTEFTSMVTNHIKKLENNRFTLDQALIQSKAFSQSKYLSTSKRDQIIGLVEKLGKTEKGCLVQLPRKFKDIKEEIDTLILKQEYKKAIDIAENIENEEDGIKFFILGYLYEKLEGFKKAENYYKKAIKYGDTNSLFNLASVYEDQGRFKESERYFIQAIKNGNTNALFGLALLCENQKRFKEAEKYYKQAVKYGDTNSLFALALMYEDQERFKEAEKYYKLTIKTNSEALFYLARAYHKQKRFEDAEKYYKQAIKYGDKGGLYGLAVMYTNLKQYKDAQKYFKKAIKKGIVEASFSLAAIFYTTNQNKEEALKLINNYNAHKGNIVSKYSQLIYEVWNGKFIDLEQRITTLIKENKTENLGSFILELLVHQQKQLVHKLFNNRVFGKELNEQFIVLNYVTQLLIEADNTKIKLEIPPELNETITAVIYEIKEQEQLFGYKK